MGEFSKMTYLSVKALWHDHDLGLLEPARCTGETWGVFDIPIGANPTAIAGAGKDDQMCLALP
jgi:hypothetical protein